mmetsp:Transcript_7322/g.8401  ORF Transcript_7322/g.8401 Transcript_7322/m.8401 type:complete len:376 (-) Transcript_7322:62-1189(-)
MDEQATLICYFELLAQPVDLQQNIVKQVEYYFSDENLPGDSFLFFKTMKRNATAWVKIKTLLTFRKLKKMAGNKQALVALSVRTHSANLEVSSDGTAIRRKHKLGKNLENSKDRIRRSIRVDNLPVNTSVASIEEKFNEIAGKVRVVRILNVTKDKRIAKPYAVVEFEERQNAKISVDHFKKKKDWRAGMMVTWMRPQDEKPPEKKNTSASIEQKENRKVFDANSAKDGNQDLEEDTYSLIEKGITGKIRSLNRASQCGFIVRTALAKTNRRRRSNKSVIFYFTSEDMKRENFAAGRQVTYSLYRNRKNGEEKAMEVIVSAREKPAGRAVENASKYKRSAGMPEKRLFSQAKGPPEGSSYTGFGIKELRGKSRSM